MYIHTWMCRSSKDLQLRDLGLGLQGLVLGVLG